MDHGHDGHCASGGLLGQDAVGILLFLQTVNRDRREHHERHDPHQNHLAATAAGAASRLVRVLFGSNCGHASLSPEITSEITSAILAGFPFRHALEYPS